jgi:glycosyltransferase involved in cell wall biosynthesis
VSPQPLNVTLVPPLPGEGWVSIERYVEAIASYAPSERLSVTTAPSLGAKEMGRIEAYRRRYRDLPKQVAAFPFAPGLIHVADQALGHVVPELCGPTVVTCHDLMAVAAEGHHGSAFKGWFDRTLLQKSLDGMTAATRIIAVSETTAREVVRLLQISPQRISVVPNIVSSAFRKVDCPQEWLLARGVSLPDGPRILSVGHSRPYKNLDTLLRALATPMLRNASLVRCGAPLTGSQRSLASALGLEERLFELGLREPEELRAIYSACDVLAQPSRAEGFGVPVVEAMACELPVVCSDAEALTEVAGGAASVAGIIGLADQDAATKLADALAEVISAPSTSRRLRREGLNRARDFAPAKVVPKLTDAYGRAVEEFAP